MSNELDSTVISVFGLSTRAKNGDRVSFERSIAFASKDARQALSATVYGRQVDNGVYGPLIRDSLAAGVLGKGAREIVETMMVGMGRNPTKASAATVCSVMLAAWVNKEPKGQKLFYVTVIRRLAESFVDAPTQGEVVGEVNGEVVSG